MHVLKALVAAAALVVVLFAHADAADPEPSEAAMTFVAGFSDDHLSGMLSKIGARQPALIALSQVHGAILPAVFDEEIDKAVAAYGPEWQRNMALAWTPLLSDAELESLTVEGGQSPYAEKYLALRPEAGAAMQDLSQDLFRTVLAEVIENTIGQFSEAGGTSETPANE